MTSSNRNGDDYHEKELERLLDKIQEMFDDPYFRERLKKILRKNLHSNKQKKHGLSINILFDKTTKEADFIHPFESNETIQIEEKQPVINTDIIEAENNVFVTVDLPGGYYEKDVELHVYPSTINITLNNPLEKTLHKSLSLPCEINPKNYDTNYNNGVLDITLHKT